MLQEVGHVYSTNSCARHTEGHDGGVQHCFMRRKLGRWYMLSIKTLFAGFFLCSLLLSIINSLEVS